MYMAVLPGREVGFSSQQWWKAAQEIFACGNYQPRLCDGLPSRTGGLHQFFVVVLPHLARWMWFLYYPKFASFAELKMYKHVAISMLIFLTAAAHNHSPAAMYRNLRYYDMFWYVRHVFIHSLCKWSQYMFLFFAFQEWSNTMSL